MTGGKNVIRSVWLILSVPLLLALMEAGSFHAANRENGAMISSGEQREYLLYVPPSYDRRKPTPLIISLHGAALWGAAQKETSQWNRVADREGFIVVYPSGYNGNGPRIWRADGGPRLARDVRFISDLIDTLKSHFNIDSSRVYANGLSNGGGMSVELACAMSDRIAAVGLVGAAHLVPFARCPDSRPVPMISFHGTDDPAAPYNGGISWVATDRFPSIPGWTARYANRNGCDAKPVQSTIAAHVTRREYVNCAGDADVVLYTIKGGGHTWPGGKPLPVWFTGITTYEIDASQLMWDFFRRHPLRRN
jgi:polyhydroxybutyrate depolymerase